MVTSIAGACLSSNSTATYFTCAVALSWDCTCSICASNCANMLAPAAAAMLARTSSAMVAARHQPETPFRSSAIGIDLVDERAQHILGLLVFDLAGASRVVATAAVLQHQLAHI